jgi:hypothetical protein
MMNDKKLMAKKLMLKSLKDDMKQMVGEGRNDLSSLLDGKKMMKVSIASDSKEGLKKGLSKAEEIMNKKLGEDFSDSSEEYDCPKCEDKGCKLCEEPMDSEEESESEMEESDSEESYEPMEDESPEELKAKIAELQKKLSKKMV